MTTPRSSATDVGRAFRRRARPLTLATAIAMLMTPALALGGTRGAGQDPGRCTMAVPPIRATVEVEIAGATDFCEFVSSALAGSVFRAPVMVTPGLLWHYAGAAVSCGLRYRTTPYRMTIRNSVAACRWLGRVAPDWRLQDTGTGHVA